MKTLTRAELDVILALQFTVAWAGETPRLGWWKADVTDIDGGGDFLARLAPQTAAWASLSLVREAARRVDDRARKRIAGGDGVWSLFHFGYDINEQLDDQLNEHRRERRVPAEVLGPWFLANTLWSVERLTRALTVHRSPDVDIAPGGRRLTIDATSPRAMATLLAAALLPFVPDYPMPYVETSQ